MNHSPAAESTRYRTGIDRYRRFAFRWKTDEQRGWRAPAARWRLCPIQSQSQRFNIDQLLMTNSSSTVDISDWCLQLEAFGRAASVIYAIKIRYTTDRILLHAEWSAIGMMLSSVCLSVYGEVNCDSQGRCWRLELESCTVVFLGGHFLFTSSDTFAVWRIVQPQHTAKNWSAEISASGIVMGSAVTTRRQCEQDLHISLILRPTSQRPFTYIQSMCVEGIERFEDIWAGCVVSSMPNNLFLCGIYM